MNRPIVRLAGVSRVFRGPPPVEALDIDTLEVGQGEYIAITGRSGSGKTTLLNLIGLLDTPTSGRYELSGMDVTTLSDRQRATIRARMVGFVFQAYHLLPQFSAVENVELGLLYQGPRRAERRSLADEALAKTGMSHRSAATAATLSGGEQQRVAIARAVSRRPIMLLADEPTGNLDSVSAEKVLDIVDTLHREEGLTVLMVTHAPDVAARAERRIHMADGRFL